MSSGYFIFPSGRAQISCGRNLTLVFAACSTVPSKALGRAPPSRVRPNVDMNHGVVLSGMAKRGCALEEVEE